MSTTTRTGGRIVPIDRWTAHPVRIYNYWLGGNDNYAVDRDAADAIAAIFPPAMTSARENHRFAARAVRHLAEQHGIDQFLDIGPGLPTDDHTHHVAQQVNPGARIVYVDNDPLVLICARALLNGDPLGRTEHLHGDLRRPDTILTSPQLATTLDLSRPVGLLILAVAHFLPGQDAYTSVRTMVDALAPGSFLVFSHATYDLLPDDTRSALNTTHPSAYGFTPRTRTQITRFFTGLDLTEPGVGVVSRWRRNPDDPPPADHHVAVVGGVASKPRSVTTPIMPAVGAGPWQALWTPSSLPESTGRPDAAFGTPLEPISPNTLRPAERR